MGNSEIDEAWVSQALVVEQVFVELVSRLAMVKRVKAILMDAGCVGERNAMIPM